MKLKFLNPLYRTRYFMVFYSANHVSGGMITGQTSFSIYGYKPFLNKKQVEDYLTTVAIGGSNFVLTGYVELKKYEYKRWLE